MPTKPATIQALAALSAATLALSGCSTVLEALTPEPYYQPAPQPTHQPGHHTTHTASYPSGPAPTLSFGDPTQASAAEMVGTYVIDPRRSAAVLFAYWESQAAMWGQGGIPEESRREVEKHYAEIDSSLVLHPGSTFTLRHKNLDEDNYFVYDGRYRMVDGTLHLDRTDVDDLPVTMESAVTFNYYRTAKFDGLVVNNYMWAMVFKRQ